MGLAELDVSINGRSYRIACEDGEEDRLLQLSEHLDRHASKLSQSMGEVGEARLMLMAGLLVGDELIEALDRIDELREELAGANAGNVGTGEHSEAINQAASRIEELAGRIKTA